MTAIEFFIAGVSFTFGICMFIVFVCMCIIFIFIGAVFIEALILISTCLIKIRIFWEIPLSILVISMLWHLDTHNESSQTMLLVVVFTAIMVVDIIMHFMNIFERKMFREWEKSDQKKKEGDGVNE